MTDTSPFPPEHGSQAREAFPPEPDEPGSPLVPEPEAEASETFPPEHGSQAREAFPPEPDEPGSPLPPE
jgi:hypothetical protein